MHGHLYQVVHNDFPYKTDVKETDYFEVDPFKDENCREIDTILTVDRTVKDKLTFSVSC